GCRQLEILDYFEDPNRHHCGSCDNCKASRVGQGSAASDGPPDSVACVKTSPADETHHARPSDVLNAIRIVLSGVARMKGRFGKQMVARMLVGSKAKEVSKYKLNSLSTFGLLASLGETQTIAFIDALLSARLLQQVEERPHLPLVRLTPRGEEVMKGAASFDEPLALDNQLRLRLRSLSIQPRAQERAPSANAVACTTRPAAAQAAADGLDELNTILAADDDNPSETEAGDASSPLDHPPHYWTYRVLSAGF